MKQIKLFTLLAAMVCAASLGATTFKQGKLPGAFSVSDTKVVYFAQGNLQYVGSWQFATNQWDVYGNTQADNHRDLFRWGSGTTPNMTCSESVTQFNEWGANAITNGGNTANMWRTLSQEEWKYLLGSRENQENLVSIGTIESVEGLILLPDDWVLPSGASLSAGSGLGSYSSNVYSSSQWAVLEAAGAVFLPGAGRLYQGNYDDEVVAAYWMSSGNSDESEALGFAPLIEWCTYSSCCPYVVPNYAYNGCYGFPVRLVSETPAPTATLTSNPTAVEGLEYTGHAQALLNNDGIAEGGTLNYSLDNSSWSEDIPTAINAGDYTVYYKVVGDASHLDYTPSPNTVAVTIAGPTPQEIAANKDPNRTSDYYSTFYHSAIKYSLPAGVEAYIATLSGDALNLTKIAGAEEVLPANTAVILKASGSSITLTPSDAAPVTYEAVNNLLGTDAALTNPSYGNVYVLSAEEGTVGFYKLANVATIPAHKAYVNLGGTGAPRRLRFVFNEENTATGIDQMENGKCENGKWIENGQLYILRNGVRYNAQGQIVK